MISMFNYLLGFVIYTLFNIITFNTYYKIKEELSKKIGLIIIYLYYSILMGYTINFFDINATLFEKGIEIIIYLIGEGVFLLTYYKNIFLPNIEKYR